MRSAGPSCSATSGPRAGAPVRPGTASGAGAWEPFAFGAIDFGLVLLSPLPAGSFRVSSPYGWRLRPTGAHKDERHFHSGLDLAAPAGTPVMAAAAGRVARRDVDGQGAGKANGNALILEHDGGVRTAYLHLATVRVKAGDLVRAGQPIGTVGSTGRSTGPHLHFMVYEGGQTRDPMSYLAPASSPSPARPLPSSVRPTTARWPWFALGASVVLGAALVVRLGRRRPRARPPSSPAGWPAALAAPPALANPGRGSPRRRRRATERRPLPFRPNG